MKTWKKSPRVLFVYLSVIGILLLFSACVDDNYNLDNVSTEVTIGGEEVVVPLGEIKPIALGDMIGEQMEGLVEENGVYTFKYEGEGDNFVIDGFSLPLISGLSPEIDAVSFSVLKLPNDFIFSKIETSFVLGYPDMSVEPAFAPIEFSSAIDLGVSLPEGGSTIPALGELSLSKSGTVPFEASFDMPSQIRSIGKVYFGESETSYGSPVNIVIAFNGLKSINGGGKLNLSVQFPSNYELLDENGRSLGNTLSVENYEVAGYDVAGDVEQIEIKAWLRSIDFAQRTVARGEMIIDDEISYSFDYTFNAIAGYVNSASKPAIEIGVAPEFRDMEIVINSVEIDNSSHNSETVYTLNGIPESVESVDYIAFEEAPVVFRIEGLEWLKTDALHAETQLPECLVFAPDAAGYLDTSTNKMVAPMRRLEEGVELNLLAIDCSKCNYTLKSGQLVIKSSISSHIANLEEGLSFMLSEVQPPVKPVNVKTIIDEAHFLLNLADSQVTIREQSFDFDFKEENLPKLSHTIDVPDEIASIERLEIASATGEKVKVRLRISHPEGEVFPVDKVYLSLAINMKQMIHPVDGQPFIEKAENKDNILRLENIEWYPNEKASLDVVEIELDAIENLPAITGEKGARKIVLDEKFAVTGGVSIDAGTDINLESTNAKIDVDFSIDDIQVSKFYGKIDYEFTPESLPEISLGDLAGTNLKISNLAVDPIIRFNINNPVAIPFVASLALKPYDADGNAIPENNVSIDDVRIAGDGVTNLVLSTKNRREQFAGEEGITFVELDLGRLFTGSMPAKIEVDMKVASDLSTSHVIDLTKSSYEIGYDYSVVVPLEFGHKFDISYDTTVTGLAGIFETIDEFPIKSVGEVAVIADFTTTIPLDFVVTTECLDENGEPTDVQISLEAENMIHGHHPEDAEPEAHSTLVLKLDLGESGELARLADIDALNFKMNIRNNSETPSAIAPDQTLSGRLRLRVKDGITVDLNDFGVK